MDYSALVTSILATVIGGALLTILFFLIKEKIFPLPNITGKWHLEMKTTNTAYNPYRGMILRYIAILWREGNKIQGTVEKIYENSTAGEIEFIGDKRTRGTVTGYLEKNYFKKDKILLHIIEKGRSRESTHFHDMEMASKTIMKGRFNSMVADQDGEVKWQRDVF